MPFSFEEKADMLKVYFKCNENSREALAAYRQEFPDRQAPHRTYFASLENALRNFGRVDRVNITYPNENVETIILASSISNRIVHTKYKQITTEEFYLCLY